MKAICLLILVLPLCAQPPAVMVPFAPLVGTWDLTVTNELTGDTYHREARRNWSPDDPAFLLESSMRDGQETVYSALTYDPRSERYRGVRCGRRGVVSLQASWDPATRTLSADCLDNNRNTGRYVLTIGDDIRWRLTLRTPEGRTIVDRSVIERRLAPPKFQRMRDSDTDRLGLLLGPWDSSLTPEGGGDSVRNRSMARWSLDGQGDFLLTQETDKLTMVTWNPEGRIYRGAFLERSGSGFFTARWIAEENRFSQHFFSFDLPQDEHGRPLPDVLFRDGIHGEIVQTFQHRMHCELRMFVRFGDTMVWQGRGETKRHIPPEQMWLMTLESHPEQGIDFQGGFRFNHGIGANGVLVPADKAARVFMDKGTIRKQGRWGLCLNVARNTFEAGNPVNLWRTFNRLEGQHRWRITDDKTLAPLDGEGLVLGWREQLMLVPADSPDRLVFANPVAEPGNE